MRAEPRRWNPAPFDLTAVHGAAEGAAFAARGGSPRRNEQNVNR